MQNGHERHERRLSDDYTEHFVIQVKGHLDPSWSECFGALKMTHTRSGETILTGPIADQAALHGILASFRNLNLPLISVNRIECEQTASDDQFGGAKERVGSPMRRRHIMISKIQDLVRRSPLVAFFPLAIGISWSIGIPLAITAANRADRPIMPFSMHYLVGYGPMVAALLLTWFTEGRAGLRELLSRILRWRVRPIWWLMAASPLIIFAVVAIGQRLFQGQWVEFALLGQIHFLPNLGWAALILWVLTFGFGEEIGWRGYALPRLQKGRSALSATLILSLFLALWHLPAFFYLYDRSILIGWLIGMVAGAIVFTWFYNSSQGSILMLAMWHGAFNFVTGSQLGDGLIAAILSTVVMVWAVVLVILFKPADLSHVKKQVI